MHMQAAGTRKYQCVSDRISSSSDLTMKTKLRKIPTQPLIVFVHTLVCVQHSLDDKPVSSSFLWAFSRTHAAFTYSALHQKLLLRVNE